MSKRPKMQPPVRLFETRIVGRLETLEQVQKLLESLDDQKGLSWQIRCRQTRTEPDKAKQAPKGRRMMP